MAISKKGSRNIDINGVVYLYKVSKVKTKSAWRNHQPKDKLSKEFLKYANYYGLGQVKDITINIVIQLKNNPVSNYYIKIHSILVDGFMGAEQTLQIKPKLISALIMKGLEEGWNPSEKGNYSISISETFALSL